LTLQGPFVKTRIVFTTRKGSAAIVISLGLLAVAVRFILIDQPFVDTWSWRQSDVAAIARNYSTSGYHFATPQIDWAGKEPGYVGTEFPILPFAAALSYGLAGIHPWVGRVQAVLFFALSIPFFFSLVREAFDEETAVWSLLFYGLAPLSIMASRCFMPDVPSMALSIVGLDLFRRWLSSGRSSFFWVSAAALALAILIKLPTAVIGMLLAVMAFERFGRSTFSQAALWIFAGIVLLPSCAWYWHAYRVAEAFYPHHFFGAGGVAIESFSWYWRVTRVTIGASLTIPLTLLALSGLVLNVRRGHGRIFWWWGGVMILFVFVVGYGNRHPWYQLPFVPIAAAFAGSACASLWKILSGRVFVRIGLAAMLIAFLCVSFVRTRMLYAERARDLRALGLALGKTTPPGAIVIVADFGDPTAFYYGERKGWHFLEKDGLYNGHPADSAAAIANLADLRKRGAGYLAFYSGTAWWPNYYQEFGQYLARTATIESDTPGYRIYRLTESLGQ
jgi:4-amino-4-deoxy-L-arabinose transferase-like glycosyltransferase